MEDNVVVVIALDVSFQHKKVVYNVLDVFFLFLKSLMKENLMICLH